MGYHVKPMVSIIVPVYNAQDFIERCVDSILQQEYTNFELLLLDDGSTDRSGEICDRYAEADKRVCVIHKENSGVSDTRNLALDRAKGNYIQFVDSDDWIAADATRLFVETAENTRCDMVICDFYRVVGERVSHKGDIKAEGLLTMEEFAGYMMEDPADFYYGVLWNKFYRNEIIKKHNLRMDHSISWCEDFMFNLEYLRYAEHVCPIHNPLYYYVKRKGSLVSQGLSLSNTIKMKRDVFSYYNNFYKHVFDEEQYEKNRLQVYKFLVDSASDGTVMPSLLPGAWKLGEEQKKDKPKYAGRDIHATLQQLRQIIAIADCGSMNEASKRLFISQPTLSAAVKELEKGLGITIFMRSNRGIVITPEGEEFLGYARAVEEQFSLLEARYSVNGPVKKKFSVSMQHYSFAVEAFIALARQFGMNEYEFAVRETRTAEVVEDVKNQKSEIGVLYLNEFNKKVISKILREAELEFVRLFDCQIYVYMSRKNPLAEKEMVSFEQLQEYPCLSFEQGDLNSFYYAEEVLSTYDYRQIIKANDRATMLNLMVGLNGYTLCSGIICQELNGDEYIAVPLDTSETMTIGYIKKKKLPLSSLGEQYIQELRKYENKVL